MDKNQTNTLEERTMIMVWYKVAFKRKKFFINGKRNNQKLIYFSIYNFSPFQNMGFSGYGFCLAFFAILATILLSPPLLIHFRTKNIPCMLLILYLLITNVMTFINAIIWSKPYDWNGNVYCDIAIRLDIFVTVGKLCALNCIALNLLMILRLNKRFLAASKFRTYFNVLMCTVLPAILTAINYIVEIYRYTLYRYKGCSAAMYSYVTIIVYLMWIFILSLILLGILVFTLISYFQKYREVSDIMNCSNSEFNHKRYAKLLIFQILMLFVMVPLLIYTFVRETQTYKGVPFNWKEIHHENWNDIYFIDNQLSSTYYQWINIGLLYMTFAIFGFGSDFRKIYRSLFFRIPFIGSWLQRKSNEAQIMDEEYQVEQLSVVNEPDLPLKDNETILSKLELQSLSHLDFKSKMVSHVDTYSASDEEDTESFNFGSSSTDYHV